MVELGVKVWYLPSIASKQALYYVLEVVSFYISRGYQKLSSYYRKSPAYLLYVYIRISSNAIKTFCLIKCIN